MSCFVVLCQQHLMQVLHGGANDVLWLQRDFHVYLVNVFDTEKAAAVRPKETFWAVMLVLHMHMPSTIFQHVSHPCAHLYVGKPQQD